MKIGIFGCSYACPVSNCGQPNYNMSGRSWMKILEEDFNYTVTSFGSSGSSMYYSYSLFKENYKKYDKIVFLGTYPDRKYCPNFGKQHVLFSNTHKDFTNIEYYEPIKIYFKYFHNPKEADDMKELMVDDIKKIGGNRTLYIDTPTTLGKVTIMEGMSRITTGNLPDDHRWCHMSNENNYIFASQVNDWLTGNPFVFDFSSFKKPTVKELKSYYALT
jgi:hypothetical protein